MLPSFKKVHIVRSCLIDRCREHTLTKTSHMGNVSAIVSYCLRCIATKLINVSVSTFIV